MQPAANKAERLLQIEALLLSYPEGLTQAEIARRTGVNRSTIHRYLPDLETFCVYETGDGRLAIDRDHYLMNVKLTLHEAMAVHLAARLMATRSDKHNPHAAAALRKLGLALEKLAPRVSAHLAASAEVMEGQAQRHDPVYLDVLETLTRAWSDGRVVDLWHRMADGRTYQYAFAPYFVEPYAVGQTTHAIGWREPPGAVRTFKVERIQRARLTERRYAIPDDFDPRSLLADAWGIWYTEAEPVEVALRFHPRVAPRVRETQWHRSEEVEEQADGGLVWRARVAEPREMIPWIRGWGADVEVLAPEELREEMVGEALKLARVYRVRTTGSSAVVERLLHCWGKTCRDENGFHPALYHMIDVGNVARVLLDERAPSRWRNVLASAFGVEAETLIEWLPYLVAGHDIGKVSATFQGLNRRQKERLEAQAFTFVPWRPDLDVHHSIVGQVYIGSEQTEPPLPQDWMRLWQDAIGGHHGVFHARHVVKEAAKRITHYEPPEWRSLRAAADRALRRLFLSSAPALEPEPARVALATVALTGFIILCDWLGSDERFFSPAEDFDLETYTKISRNRARRAARRAGFLQRIHSEAPTSFAALFPDKSPARPLQLAIDDIPQEIVDGPVLAIIEAPTGEGKTEAALALAHRLGQADGSDALYYALPTTATSNQMYLRAQEHLTERLALPGDVQLIHGQAHLLQDDLGLVPMGNGEREPSEEMIDWFTSTKRAILAPFGVGTIDQAELAALNVKHSALRLLGLAGKVLILDEVHAYDTYMTTIVETLLEWLSALGTSVIILSATLPRAQRAALAHAYAADLPKDDEQGSKYPSLWVLGPGRTPYHCSPAPYQTSRTIQVRRLHLIDDAAADKARWLLNAVAEGGCACWIANTVNRAQDIFDSLRACDAGDVDLMLLHARFPLEDRQRRERRIAARYGPAEGERPHRGIVVGTQVLEQSLDLDFDVMVSDLAPIDLLLQRAGRLQRHARARPKAYAGETTLWINVPRTESGAPDIETDAYIYAEYLLLRTWQELVDRTEVSLPNDYRTLVEAVYGRSVPEGDEALQEARDTFQIKRSLAVQEARLRLIPGVEAGRSFCRRITASTFEEDETSAAWVVAQTRLGQASVAAIPLESDGDWARLIPLAETVEPNCPASREMAMRMLRRQLRIGRPEIVKALKAAPLPALFTRTTRLRGYYPLWLNNGSASFPLKKGELNVILDPELGLIIRRSRVD